MTIAGCPAPPKAQGPVSDFAVDVKVAPRRSKEVADLLLKNREMNSCWSQSKGEGRELEVIGKLGFDGQFQEVTIQAPEFDSLASCLKSALSRIEMGRGRIGPVQILFKDPASELNLMDRMPASRPNRFD